MAKLSEKKGGGLIYNPPMMQFDGSTGWYNKSGVTTAGNKLTVMGTLDVASFSGGGAMRVASGSGPAAGRFFITLRSNDYATADQRDKVFFTVTDSSSVTICNIGSESDFADIQGKAFYFSFDGDAGEAILVIAGRVEDNLGVAARVAPTTGTLSSGAGSTFGVGADYGGGTKLNGAIGFYAYKDAYDTDWQQYIDQYGNPKPTNFSGWLFGHFAGMMTENEGTAGAMTKNGTITLVDLGQVPHIGLPTIGTAEAWHLKTGKIAWVDGVEKVGSGYFPAMMEFDGSSGYYSGTYTSSGNKITFACTFKIASFTGSATQKALANATSGGNSRFSLAVRSADWSTADQQGKLLCFVQNSSGTAICLIFSDASVLDDEKHTLFFEFDGDAGTTVFKIDGADNDDTGVAARVAPTTGTLSSGAASLFSIGQTTGVSAGRYWTGQVGFAGMRDVGGLTWSDFMQTDGSPKQLDESTWTEWGAQPLFWHESGLMTENKGSAGAMTKNGNIVLAPASSWS